METGLFQNSDDILNVSRAGCFFEDLEKDCEGSEQRSDLNPVPCTCDGERRGWCGEIRFGIALCSSRSEWRGVGENEVESFRHTFQKEQIKREREGGEEVRRRLIAGYESRVSDVRAISNFDVW